jgi:peroxiredoxin
MKYSFLPLVAAAALVPLSAVQAGRLTASTGAPTLIDTGSTGTTFAMTEAQYQRFVEETGSKSPDFVAIIRKPDGLSPKAQFGINLALRGKILSWAIDGDETEGYVLFADWNGNGDLRDETPTRFERVDGKPTIRVAREERDGAVTYPVPMKLMLDWVVPPTKTEKQLALKIYNRTTRSGELRPPGGKPVTFRLTGSAGFYAQSFNSVAFDLDGDGTLKPETEVFRVSEKYVNIGDTSYEFVVDPHGETLTLNPLAEHRPSRVTLTAGASAPDFAFTDLEGKPRRLSEYRGKVVLLDFWGAWCAPCVAEAPKLVAAYAKYRDRGFEIIGIDTIDTREKMLAFIDTHKMRWTQTMEADKGPIQTLYRISGFPSYVLIGPDGAIKVGVTGSNIDLDRELRVLFPQ